MTSFHKIVLTPTTKLQDTWGGLAGIKMRSNVIIRSQTLFYVENCASLSDFLRMGMGGGVLQSNKLASERTGVMDETVVSVLAGKHPHEPPPSPRSMLEVYNETPILILIEITYDVVESVAQKRLGILGPGSMDPKSLEVWILKFVEDSKKLRTSVEFLSIDWPSDFSLGILP